MLLVAHRGIGEPGPVEREAALGGHVLQEVEVAPAEARPVGEADAQGAERAADGVVERHDDEGRVVVDLHPVEARVALAPLGVAADDDGLAGPQHLGRRQRGRQGDAAEALLDHALGHARGPGHFQRVPGVGQDVEHRGAAADDLQPLVEHRAHDLGRMPQPVEPLDQADHAGRGPEGPGGVDQDPAGPGPARRGARGRRDRMDAQDRPAVAAGQAQGLLPVALAGQHRPQPLGGAPPVAGVEQRQPAVAAQLRPGGTGPGDVGADADAAAAVVPGQDERGDVAGQRSAARADVHR